MITLFNEGNTLQLQLRNLWPSPELNITVVVGFLKFV